MNEDLKWLAENVHEWPEEFEQGAGSNWSGIWRDGLWVRLNGYTRAQWQAARDELSGKPSWDDAPEWANWICQNSQGAWYFLDIAPDGVRHDRWDHVGRWSYSPSEGKVFGDWRNTLERRPDSKPEPVKQWRGPEDGLPPVGMRVKLHNDQGFLLDYMQSAIGEEVTVKAVFYSGDSNIPMAAVETDDKTCGCFRVAMIKPCKTEEDRAIEEMMSLVKQDYSSISRLLATPKEYVEDAVVQLYRAGYRKQEAE